MIIKIKNPSSAGASLTSPTINVLKDVYKYCVEHPSSTFSLEPLIKDFSFSWCNSRNIFPLMRYLGFVDYNGGFLNLNTDTFFTERGTAFMDTILLEESEECTDSIALDLQLLRFSLVKGGLNLLVCNESCNYQWIFRRVLEFLQIYKKINKKEFAYLVYSEANGIGLKDDIFSNTIKSYRNHSIDIDVIVIIRNNQERGIRELTAYNYVVRLLCQAGIINEVEDYYLFDSKMSNDVCKILKGIYEEQARYN